MSDPRVSVIVPVFNGRRFLAEAIASIQAQTFRSFEIIAVDDGSTDGSLEQAAANPGIRGFRQEHAGVAAARNRGLAEARGDLIAFLDQDDCWTPDKLQMQVAHLDDDPACRIVVGRTHVLLEDGQPEPVWLRDGALAQDLVAYPPGAWLVRAELFRTVGLFDACYVNASDTDWLVRARDAGVRPHALDRTALIRRIHRDNASHATKRRRPELFQILASSIKRQRDQKEVTHAGP